MPTYLSPGVYVEEVEAGSRPIEGVGTAVAAFVGLAAGGPGQHADPGHELDPVHPDVRRLRRGLVPRPRRVRLLPQRRRRVLRRAHRRRRRRPTPIAPTAEPSRSRRGAAGRARRLPRRGARSRAERQADHASRSPTVDGDGRRGHVQADRQARRQGRGDVRQRDRPSAARTTSSPSVKDQSKLITIEEIAHRRGSSAARRPAASRLAGAAAPPAAGAASPPTTTSATSPTAPASPGSRRSTRSRCSPCPT